jgi:sulfur transfer protein SufE
MLTWMVLPRILMEHKKREREELIKKCKSLLWIAQRARQAKDEAEEEIEIKEQLKTLQI